MKKNYDLYKDNFIDKNHFFCISHFNGDIEWVSQIDKNNYIVYNKSGEKLSKEINHVNIKT